MLCSKWLQNNYYNIACILTGMRRRLNSQWAKFMGSIIERSLLSITVLCYNTEELLHSDSFSILKQGYLKHCSLKCSLQGRAKKPISFIQNWIWATQRVSHLFWLYKQFSSEIEAVNWVEQQCCTGKSERVSNKSKKPIKPKLLISAQNLQVQITSDEIRNLLQIAENTNIRSCNISYPAYLQSSGCTAGYS